MEKKNKKKIAIIIPVYNESGCIEKFIDEINILKKELDEIIELIFIDDGSNDETFKVLTNYANLDKSIKIIKLRKNYGKELALTAGLNSIGSDYHAAITMDVDLQHPPKLIKNLISEWQNGFPLVLYVRKSNDDEKSLRRFFGKLFYNFLNWFLDFQNLKFNTDYRIYDKKVINEFNALNSQDALFRVKIDSLGFQHKVLMFDAPSRSWGVAKYSVYKLLRSAAYSIFDLSVKPLKLIFIFSILFFTVNSLVFVFVSTDYFITNKFSFSSRTIILIFNLMITSINFVVLGIICIYLSSIKNLISNKKIYKI